MLRETDDFTACAVRAPSCSFTDPDDIFAQQSVFGCGTPQPQPGRRALSNRFVTET